jgi:hypothetical protein
MTSDIVWRLAHILINMPNGKGAVQVMEWDTQPAKKSRQFIWIECNVECNTLPLFDISAKAEEIIVEKKKDLKQTNVRMEGHML